MTQELERAFTHKIAHMSLDGENDFKADKTDDQNILESIIIEARAIIAETENHNTPNPQQEPTQ